jgi:hypothetical protein
LEIPGLEEKQTRNANKVKIEKQENILEKQTKNKNNKNKYDRKYTLRLISYKK